MSNAFNLSQLANNVNTSGQVSASTGVSGTLPVANGGTGRTTNTAYAVICGGTTNGGVEQSIVSVGSAGQVLTSNGAGALPTFQAAGGGGSGFTAMQTFTSSGTFTIPTGKTVVKVTVVGGGGNGGGGVASGGSGGGGGGAAIKYLTGLTPGNTLTVTRGGAGGTSSVSSGTQSISTISATGGANGVDYYPGGSGGSGSGGDLNVTGDAGMGGIYHGSNYYFGGLAVGGVGGGSIFGGSGKGGHYGSGTSGVNGGGGGGGANNDGYGGGTGGNGLIVFEY